MATKFVKTPVFRVSFPHVFEKHAFGEEEPKFSLTMLFEEGEDLSELEAICEEALIDKFGEKMKDKKFRKKLDLPFRDGEDKEELDGYEEGMKFANAKGQNKPKMRDRQRRPIEDDPEAFYAGCYARAMVNAYAYDTAGNVGVAFGLGNILKWADGDPFSGGGGDPDEDFDDDFEDDEETEGLFD